MPLEPWSFEEGHSRWAVEREAEKLQRRALQGIEETPFQALKFGPLSTLVRLGLLFWLFKGDIDVDIYI